MPDETESVARAPFARTYRLEDIAIRAGGDGRTVVAYAAVFDSPTEIHDLDGHYTEVIARHGFDKTISERAGRVCVFYNHGKTLYGTPSERFSVPLGVPEEIKADQRGLMTVTRYNRNALADEVLESIRNGDITGQSFSGKWLRSQRTRGRSGELDTIIRNEVMLTEYGPTPIPAYQDAAIVGVRAAELADALAALSPDERADVLTQCGVTYTGGLTINTTAANNTLAVGTFSGTRSVDAPPNADDAGSTTSSTDDTPPSGHASGYTPNERRSRVIALKGIHTQ